MNKQLCYTQCILTKLMFTSVERLVFRIKRQTILNDNLAMPIFHRPRDLSTHVHNLNRAFLLNVRLFRLLSFTAKKLELENGIVGYENIKVMVI